MVQKAEMFSDTVENIVGKGENVGHQLFSFSHQVFKGFFPEGLCGKSLTLYHTIPTFNDPENVAS